MLNSAASKFSFVANTTFHHKERRRESADSTTAGRRLLMVLPDPNYQLLRPLVVHIRRGSVDPFIVTIADDALDFGLYGSGVTLQDALDDFAAMLLDMFGDLEASEAALSRGLTQRLHLLRDIIARRQ